MSSYLAEKTRPGCNGREETFEFAVSIEEDGSSFSLSTKIAILDYELAHDRHVVEAQ